MFMNNGVKQMTKFAAYDNYSIYAVANTASDAIAFAIMDSGDKDAQFETAPISDELAAWIDENGWNGNRDTFEIDRATGHIIDTTKGRR